jgi:hypothetical protein
MFAAVIQKVQITNRSFRKTILCVFMMSNNPTLRIYEFGQPYTLRIYEFGQPYAAYL